MYFNLNMIFKKKINNYCNWLVGHSQLDQYTCCVSLKGRQEGGNWFVWRNNYPEVAKYKEMQKHKFKISVNSREEVPRNGPHSAECQKNYEWNPWKPQKNVAAYGKHPSATNNVF